MLYGRPPREELKEIRSRLGITTRDVADFSQKIAEMEGNPEFHISNAWLTQVENSDSVPSIFKLYSLSSIYRLKFTDLLLLYGVDIQHLDIRHGLYGYIGLQDMTLYPLLRPGSFVQIDPRVRKVQPMRWRTEFDRPIYFVELRDGYACSWCDLLDDQLLLLPHPLSPCSVRKFKYGTDAEIVGQVTAVAMRLSDASDSAPDGNAKLPRRV